MSTEDNHIKSQLGQYDPNVAHPDNQSNNICSELKKILDKEIKEGSEAELKLRQEINKHLSECKFYSCYLEKVERINKGLY